MLWLDGWCLQHEASETKPSLCLYWKEKGNKIISLISINQKETILPWLKTEHLHFRTCSRSAKMSFENDLWRKETALLQLPICYVNSAVPFCILIILCRLYSSARCCSNKSRTSVLTGWWQRLPPKSIQAWAENHDSCQHPLHTHSDTLTHRDTQIHMDTPPQVQQDWQT